MKRIICHFPAGNNLCAGFVVLLALAAIAYAAHAAPSARPQIGGTLRVQMSERIPTIDPRQWPTAPALSAAAERLDSLIFDRLIQLDEHGTIQPVLAISWQHDEQSKHWQFRMRDGVKFTDGMPLTPPIAALALQQLLGAAFDVSATSDSVVIQAEHSLPDFPTQLAVGRYFIFKTGEDNSLTGTGAFRVAEWPMGEGPGRAIFVANVTCWAGRPFVEKIELSMGVDFQRQANAISFGQADIVELPASQVRRAIQRGVRAASSDPIELFALVLDANRPALQDVRTRQAISLAIDRTSIADVILQRQGAPAGSLLPNWISGYAHLYPAASDLPRARNLQTASVREHSRSMPLVLFYDASDAEARAIADRVAVNLREIGIMVQVSGQTAEDKTKLSAADLRLVRHRMISPDPAVALSALLNLLGEAPTNVETPEQNYAAERGPINTFRVIPIVHTSENFGLSPQVRDWMAPRWGGWKLEEVWLGPPSAEGGNSR
jgi:ABC-type transport system substrate-binding protein